MANFAQTTVPQFSPYIPTIPVEAYTKVGMFKQQQYEQGIQKIQQSIDSIAGLPVDSKFSPYIQDKLSNLQKTISTLPSGDYSNEQLVNHITSTAAAITKDPIVRNAILSTAAIQKKKQYIDDIKTKHPELYSATNEQDAMASVRKWRENPNLSVQYVDSTPYIPYYDTSKEVMDLEKQYMSLPTSYTETSEDKNGEITTKTYSGKSPQGFLEYLQSHASDKFKAQISLEGRVKSDGLDDDTWYSTDYIPEKKQHILQLQQQITDNNRKKGATISSTQSQSLDAENSTLKAKIAQIQSELTDPQAKQQAITNKRELSGQYHLKNTLINIANSLHIPTKPNITFSADEALIHAIDRGSDKSIAEMKSGKGLQSPTFGPDGKPIYPDDRIYGPPRLNKNDVQSSGYKDFQDMIASLQNETVNSFKPLFKNWAQSKGYTPEWLTSPDNSKEAKEEFTGYLTSLKNKYDKNHDDPSIPENIRSAFSGTKLSTVLLVGLHKKDLEIQQNALKQAISNGLTSFVYNGVTITPQDVFEYKKTGSNEAIEKAQAVRPVGYSENPVASARFGPHLAGTRFNVEMVPNDILKEKLKLIPDTDDQYNNIVAQEGIVYTITNENDEKNKPANTETIRTLTNYANEQIAGAQSSNEKTDITGDNNLEGITSLSPDQVKSVQVNQLTGNAWFTVDTKNDKGKVVTKTFMINLPKVKVNYEDQKSLISVAKVNNGYVPMRTQGEKPFDIQMYSNGTEASDYTLDKNGNPAVWKAKTLTGQDIPIKAFPNGMNNPAALMKQIDETAKAIEYQIKISAKNNFESQYGPQWENLSQKEKHDLLLPVIKNAINNIDESEVFGTGESDELYDVPY